MEIQCSNPPSLKVRAGRERMSLEDYMDFLLSQKQLNLTVNFLRQIIHMHGFKKMHQYPKKVLEEAVNSLDLMEPSRSTLDENVSSLEFVAFEDVVADLNGLNWQECRVTSIQTLNSWKPMPAKDPTQSGADEVCGVGGVLPRGIESVSREPSGKRVNKRKISDAFKAVGGESCKGVQSSGCVSVGSFGSC